MIDTYQRCFKVQISPGVYEGPNYSQAPEHEARLYKSERAAKMSAAVRHRHGTPVECMVIPSAHLRDLEFCERMLEALAEHGVDNWDGYSDAIACAEDDGPCDVCGREGDEE